MAAKSKTLSERRLNLRTYFDFVRGQFRREGDSSLSQDSSDRELSWIRNHLDRYDLSSPVQIDGDMRPFPSYHRLCYLNVLLKT